jgi:uncharacterized phage protein (TIGR02218 family)
MRTIPAGLQSELDGTTAALCHLLTVTRRNGDVARYAAHQAAVTVDGQTYYPVAGLRVSPIRYRRNSPGSTVDFETTLSDDTGSLDEDDLRKGLWDHAEVVISFCSYLNPGNGKVDLWRGFCGQVDMSDRFHAKIQAVGLMSKARKITIPRYATSCRADFGDAKCGKNIEPLKISTTVSSVSGYSVVVGDAAAQLRLGLIVPTSGDSVGEAFEIRSVSGTTLKTYLQLRGQLAAGDAVDLYPGCDHSLDGDQGCVFWDNVVNFRGEPFIPGDHTVRVRWTDDAIAGL